METTDDHRRKVVLEFCAACVWAKSIRNHFAVLFESGERRLELLGEVARTFFHDLNQVLIEYILLQQCKLVDPANSGAGKDNLSSNYIATLTWQPETAAALERANTRLKSFHATISKARSKLIAHADLTSYIEGVGASTFTKEAEEDFWRALQEFVHAAHAEAVGGPFEIDAAMPDGDANSLIRCLVEAVDYGDMIDRKSVV